MTRWRGHGRRGALVGLGGAVAMLVPAAYGACASTAPALDAGDSSDSGDGAPLYRFYLDPCPPPVGNCEPLNPVPIITGNPTCADRGIAEGTPCADPNATDGGGSCVLGPSFRDDTDGREDCRKWPQRLVCRSTPYSPDAGCRVSIAASKKQIQYLTAAERTQVAEEIRGLPLVRYRYKHQTDEVTPTVGIVIEDVPGASFVERDGKHVNLYSFVSATAAAYQAQAAELDVTRAQLRGLEARLADLEARCPGPGAAGAPVTRAARK